jgi:YggT family protein
MLVAGNILITVGHILGSIIFIMNIFIIAAVIMSWVSADPRNPLVQFVKNATEPMFSWVRRYIKPIGMIDLSPIVILLLLQLVNGVIVASLIQYGEQIK